MSLYSARSASMAGSPLGPGHVAVAAALTKVVGARYVTWAAKISSKSPVDRVCARPIAPTMRGVAAAEEGLWGFLATCSPIPACTSLLHVVPPSS